MNLGRFPLPIEVVPFGLTVTERTIARLLDSLGLSGELRLRKPPTARPTSPMAAISSSMRISSASTSRTC